MHDVSHDRRGMALALTLVALVIVGALVASALFSGTEEQRMGENTRLLQQSFGVAEGAAYGAIGTWPANRSAYAGRRAYPLDSGVSLRTDPSQSGWYSGSVYRLNNTLYLVDVTGRDTAGRGSQRLGLLLRIAPPQADIQAALTLASPVTGGGSPRVIGTDTPPAGSNWTDCGPTKGSVAGIRTTPDTSALLSYGSTDYGALVRLANVQLAPGSYTPAPMVLNGVCETEGQPGNWGDGNDHSSPCGAYFPTIWLNGMGTSTITGGQGQGVLLVDGDLAVTGPFAFYGLIAVRGALTVAQGAAVNVYGVVSARSADLAGSGSVTVSWSSCAVANALLGAGVVALNRSRSWVPLY